MNTPFKVLTLDNLGKTIKKGSDNKFDVAVDNSTININSEGQLAVQKEALQANAPKTVWTGKVSSGNINLSEPCFGKTLVFYIQHSNNGELNNNTNVEILNFTMGGKIEGKTQGNYFWEDLFNLRIYLHTLSRETRDGYRNYSAVFAKNFIVSVDVSGINLTITNEQASFSYSNNADNSDITRYIKRIDIL